MNTTKFDKINEEELIAKYPNGKELIYTMSQIDDIYTNNFFANKKIIEIILKSKLNANQMIALIDDASDMNTSEEKMEFLVTQTQLSGITEYEVDEEYHEIDGDFYNSELFNLSNLIDEYNPDLNYIKLLLDKKVSVELIEAICYLTKNYNYQLNLEDLQKSPKELIFKAKMEYYNYIFDYNKISIDLNLYDRKIDDYIKYRKEGLTDEKINLFFNSKGKYEAEKYLPYFYKYDFDILEKVLKPMNGINGDDQLKMLEIFGFNRGEEKFNFIKANRKRINANIGYMYTFFKQGGTSDQLAPLMQPYLTKAEYHEIRQNLLREIKKQ